jgi:tripartite-type tricarboxylate transporter receptor subunit TctC
MWNEKESKMKRFLGKALLATLFCAAAAAQAQDFPSKPIRIIVPYSPGGGTDTVARLIAQKLTAAFGQSVIVDNKPGASANIGAEMVARAPADGYTVLVTAPNFTTSEALFEKLSWKFEDFTPVIHLVRYGNVLVAGPGTQLANVQQMIAQAKANPKSLSFGSAGTGSNSHLAMELLNQRTGTQIVHVPYKGSGPLKTDLLGGHLPLGVDGLGGLSELIRAGKVKPLAVLAPKRSSLAPEIPSLGDMGINDVDGNGWYGALVPAATPPAVVAKLNASLAAALQAPDVHEQLVKLGVEAVGGSSEEFRNYLLGERKKWAGVIKTANIKPD